MGQNTLNEKNYLLRQTKFVESWQCNLMGFLRGANFTDFYEFLRICKNEIVENIDQP